VCEGHLNYLYRPAARNTLDGEKNLAGGMKSRGAADNPVIAGAIEGESSFQRSREYRLPVFLSVAAAVDVGMRVVRKQKVSGPYETVHAAKGATGSGHSRCFADVFIENPRILVSGLGDQTAKLFILG